MRVAVLLGGTSEERRVSLASGGAVCGALREKGHSVVVIDPASGVIPAAAEAELALEAGRPGPPSDHERETLAASALGPRIAEIPELLDADVAFLALHGRGSEDGQLQAILDAAGICYTGAGMLGSAIAFDKRVSKELMRYADLATPDWAPAGLSADAVTAMLGLPLVVKPSGGGSTVGLTVVREETQLEAAIELARHFGDDVLVESFVPGRELTVTILEGQALPAVEIVPGNEIYDYESKYTAGMSQYLVPAP
ncbi:MAG: D-alanine--D-alanine ligase, partial [Gemmatimonadota bacterium]